MVLSAKLIIIITVLTLTSASILGYSIFTLTQNALEGSIIENQFDLTSETMGRVDQTIYERYLDIQDFSNSIILEKFILGTATKRDVQQRLNSFFNTSGPWDIIKIVGKDGKIIFSSKEELVNTSVNINKETKIAFEAALSGKVYVSDLVVSDDTGSPTIFFASPMLGGTDIGRPILGAAIGQFSWQAIEEILSLVGSKEKNIYLCNKAGDIIASSDAGNEPFFRNVAEQSFFKHAQEGVSFSTINLGASGESESLFTHTHQFGSLNYKGSDWTLFIESPTSIIFAPARQNAQKILLILVFIISIFTATLFLFLNRIIIRPIKILTEVAKAISSGDTSMRAKITSEDEIETLAHSFNKAIEDLITKEKKNLNLTKDLQSLNVKLERDVADRTQKLQEKLHDLERFNELTVGRELKLIELKEEIARLKKKTR